MKKDIYILALKERIKDKEEIVKSYYKKIKEIKNTKLEYTYNALIGAIIEIERAIKELYFCLNLYKEMKGGLNNNDN